MWNYGIITGENIGFNLDPSENLTFNPVDDIRDTDGGTHLRDVIATRLWNRHRTGTVMK